MVNTLHGTTYWYNAYLQTLVEWVRKLLLREKNHKSINSMFKNWQLLSE